MSVAALSGAPPAYPPAASPAAPAPIAAKPPVREARPVSPSPDPPAQPLLASHLTIEFDEASKRFVQTLLDPSQETVLRRFPNESQLAFSRGVNAYMQAMRETVAAALSGVSR